MSSVFFFIIKIFGTEKQEQKKLRKQRGQENIDDTQSVDFLFW